MDPHGRVGDRRDKGDCVYQSPRKWWENSTPELCDQNETHPHTQTSSDSNPCRHTQITTRPEGSLRERSHVSRSRAHLYMRGPEGDILSSQIAADGQLSLIGGRIETIPCTFRAAPGKWGWPQYWAASVLGQWGRVVWTLKWSKPCKKGRFYFAFHSAGHYCLFFFSCYVVLFAYFSLVIIPRTRSALAQGQNNVT